MPGAHKSETLTEVFELRPQEVIYVELLNSQVGLLDVIWTVVFTQRKYLN